MSCIGLLLSGKVVKSSQNFTSHLDRNSGTPSPRCMRETSRPKSVLLKTKVNISTSCLSSETSKRRRNKLVAPIDEDRLGSSRLQVRRKLHMKNVMDDE